MTPHKEDVKEPINKIILWPTFHAQWESNSTYQVKFTAFDIGSELYDELDVESHFFLDGQEYVAKSCVENIDSNTKEILAWHIYNEINRLYVRSDLSETKINSSNNNQQEQTPSYSVEDVLKKWLDNNKLGFTYEIHGNFEKKQIEGLSGTGKDMLSKIVDAWPNIIVFPDNKKVRIYDESEFFKDEGRVLDFPHDLKSLKTTRDSRTIINQIRCVGGKHSIDISTDGGSGGNLDSVEAFAKSAINADFAVNKDQMCQDFANRSQKVQARGVDVYRLYDTIKKAGVSPEWFFAYELQEQNSNMGWLNHWSYPHGDPYNDATVVCDWIKQTAYTDYLTPAWSAAEGSIGRNPALEAQWNQQFGKGTIGRLYLQATAAAVWELSGQSGNSYIGKPMSGCVSQIKTWGGHTNSGGGSWGWPFPDTGEGKFTSGQLFGVQPGGGFRTNGFHDGLDFGSVDHPGTDVHAIHGGKVTTKAWGGSEVKWYVVITDGSGLNVEYQEAFSNQGNIIVNVGDSVTTGQVIGYRDTDHLHVGITRHSFPEAFNHAFLNDGTWLDPQQTIKSGIAAGGSSDNSGTTSEEVYYFEPFILEDEESIKEWGLQPGPDFVDESFTDAEAMRKVGLTKLKPNPDLTVETTLKGNNFIPKQGEIVRVQARSKKYAGSWRVVAYDYYPRAANQDTSVTLNKTKQTILDYQAQRTNQIQSALSEQTVRLKGVASSLDKQSQSLTQVINDSNENTTDKQWKDLQPKVQELINEKFKEMNSINKKDGDKQNGSDSNVSE